MTLPSMQTGELVDVVDEILAQFAFSDFARKSTRTGERWFRAAKIGETVRKRFWEVWHKEKGELHARGFDVTKYASGDWYLVQWLNLDGTVTEHSLEKASRVRHEGADAKSSDWIPDDVSLEHPAAGSLFPYQRHGALRLKRALLRGNALDASDTGTGKTFVALAVAAELGLTPCIVAPLAVLPSWQRAAEMLGIAPGWIVNYDRIRGGRSGHGHWHAASLCDKKFVFDGLPEKPLLIFDECQKCKSPRSLQGQILRDAARAGHKILCLSATAAKDPTEMRNVGAVLGLHDGGWAGFREFCQAYGCGEGLHGLRFDNRRRRLLEKLHTVIFPEKGNRMRVADLPEFPETSIIAETLVCETQAIQLAYDEMERVMLSLKDTPMSAAERQGAHHAQMMKARVAAERGKLKLFRELAEAALEEGRSVVIFLNFRDHVDALAKVLDTRCLIRGGQSAEERQQWIDAFQADRERVCIVSLQAGGAGLSLHDVRGEFPRQAIISPSFSAIDMKQALGRVHRAGARTKSHQLIIFAAGTIEEKICTSVREKLTNIDKLNDGHLSPPSLLRGLSGE